MFISTYAKRENWCASQHRNLGLLMGAFLSLYPLISFAGTYENVLTRTNFFVFTRDYNNDGFTDFLLRPKPKMVSIPIDDDLNIVFNASARSPTFLLLSGPNGFSLVDPAVSGVDINTGWGPSPEFRVTSNPAGQANAIRISSNVQGEPSFTVAMDNSTGSLSLVNQFRSSSDRLWEGERLPTYKTLISPNGHYTLKLFVRDPATNTYLSGVYRADGARVHYMGNAVSYMALGPDGNLISYNDFGGQGPYIIWSSNTAGRCPCPSPAYVRLWNDGNLTVQYGEMPQVAPYYGLIFETGKDPAPLTTTTGFEEYGRPSGIPPSVVPDPPVPASLD